MTKKYFVSEVRKYVTKQYEYCLASIKRSEYHYDTLDRLYVVSFSERCLGVIEYLEDKNFENIGTKKYHSLCDVASEWRENVSKMSTDLFNLNWELNRKK